jgi:DNA replication and repair protein RecF
VSGFARLRVPPLPVTPGLAAAAVTRLTLTAFRSTPAARIDVDSRPVVITGPNGAGKTNLLEALSFLAPGRGLRGAAMTAISHRMAGAITNPPPWAVAATVDLPEGQIEIGTGLDGVPAGDDGPSGKRVVHVAGTRHRGQAVLARHVGVVWLTPAMDRLFLDAPSTRRRFLDRLAIAFDPDHAGRTAAYERALRQRARLIRDGSGDTTWFASLEDTLARYGAAVAAARRHLIDRLNAVLAGPADGLFPSAHLSLVGDVDRWLEEQPSLTVEDRLRARLAESRRPGAINEPGPHRSDLAATLVVPGHRSHGQSAAMCSTGEQKALLIAVVLAHARLQSLRRGHAPLLLLDEIAAHLDADRRAGLFRAILEIGAQAWLTGTDPVLFEGLGSLAQGLTFENGQPKVQKNAGSV